MSYSVSTPVHSVNPLISTKSEKKTETSSENGKISSVKILYYINQLYYRYRREKIMIELARYQLFVCHFFIFNNIFFIGFVTVWVAITVLVFN